jgi:quinoprotein glucose dehydrogenase
MQWPFRRAASGLLLVTITVPLVNKNISGCREGLSLNKINDMKHKWTGLFAGVLLMFRIGLPAQSPASHPEPSPAPNPAPSPAGSWSYYGRDAGGQRYTSVRQINDRNVDRLTVAWTYRTGELDTYAGTHALEKACFETTPILIGRSLYFTTASDRVIAVDAATGQQHWVYDPKVDLNGDYSEFSSRGVAAWPAGERPRERSPFEGKADPGSDSLRLFVGTIDGRLIALNAHTGHPITAFGDKGTIDLRAGLGKDIQETSPPAVIGDLVIVGSAIGDNQRFDEASGAIRAYSVHTGQLIWAWDPIPRNPADSAYATWNGPKAHQTGAANAWSILSTDPARDLVFIPTSCPSPDYYGGMRIGSNLYANSLVALRASTGQLVWSFQVVHHDIWDFDIAAQPVLIDFPVGPRTIPAVVIGTKMGFIYVLDRETGKPLLPVEERPVPASTLPGEQAWPTQHFPVRPAPLGLQSMSADSAWGLTPEDLAEAKRRIAQLRYEGPFTPPGFQGTIMAPGNVGGIHWGGMCYDPVGGILYTNINRVAAVIRMMPRDEVDSLRKENPETLRGEIGWQRGTPYIMKRDYLVKRNDQGAITSLQTKPPWGTLVAIDLHSGVKKWEVALGFMLDPTKYPEARQWGSLNFGGAIVTGGHLIFVAASMDGYFRAFDSRTGKVLWEYGLPASGQATPMSYVLDGRQYVVIAAGGHGKLGTKQGDYLMAFALPAP